MFLRLMEPNWTTDTWVLFIGKLINLILKLFGYSYLLIYSYLTIPLEYYKQLRTYGTDPMEKKLFLLSFSMSWIWSILFYCFKSFVQIRQIRESTDFHFAENIFMGKGLALTKAQFPVILVTRLLELSCLDDVVQLKKGTQVFRKNDKICSRV